MITVKGPITIGKKDDSFQKTLEAQGIDTYALFGFKKAEKKATVVVPKVEVKAVPKVEIKAVEKKKKK